VAPVLRTMLPGTMARVGGMILHMPAMAGGGGGGGKQRHPACGARIEQHAGCCGAASASTPPRHQLLGEPWSGSRREDASPYSAASARMLSM